MPSNLKELRSFLGFAGYYRRFIPQFAHLAKPLNDLLVEDKKEKKKSRERQPLEWGEIHQKAFEIIIDRLCSAPVLTYADFSKPFILNIDASSVGLGAVLYQKVDGVEKVVAYASRGLRGGERNYPAHKLEFLSLKWAVVDKFYDYLYGNEFCVRTDNNPLTYAFKSAKLDALSHRWLAALSAFNFNIVYRSGKENIDADILSRLPGVSRSEENVMFPDVIKALFDYHLVRVCPIIECLSFSQTAAQTPRDEVDLDTPLADIDWKVEQARDRAISRVAEILKSSSRLTRRQMCLEDESVRKLLRERNMLFFRDGLLYRHGMSNGHPVDQLVVPDVFYDIIFAGLHDEAGHQGKERTLSLIKSRFFWPGLDSFVETRIRLCERCICRKTREKVSAELVSIETTYPLELVCIDFLTLDMSKGGFEKVLVITDHFTRYAQAIPMRNETARSTAKALFEQFIVHYGFPSRLHSDQGRNFESAIIRELCDIAKVEKSRTTPYHPQCNGMAERFNQTLMNMIGTLDDERKQNWKAHLPTLVHAYNATRHESTGMTPYFLMFGRHPRLAIDAFLGIEPDFSSSDRSTFIQGIQERLGFAYKAATREARRQARRHKRRYDTRVREAKVAVGDKVLVKMVGIRGRHKLADRWCRDVYVVISQPNPDIPVFRVRKEFARGPVRTLHRNLILPLSGIPLLAPLRSPDSRDLSGIDVTDDTDCSGNISEAQQALPQSSLSPTAAVANTAVQCDNLPDMTHADVLPSLSTPSPRYVIPQRRTRRITQRPAWMQSDTWVT